MFRFQLPTHQAASFMIVCKALYLYTLNSSGTYEEISEYLSYNAHIHSKLMDKSVNDTFYNLQNFKENYFAIIANLSQI